MPCLNAALALAASCVHTHMPASCHLPPAHPLAGVGAPNIIPQSVNLLGTIRAIDHELFGRLRQRVTDVFTSTAAMYGCNATIEWSPASGRESGGFGGSKVEGVARKRVLSAAAPHSQLANSALWQPRLLASPTKPLTNQLLNP